MRGGVVGSALVRGVVPWIHVAFAGAAVGSSAAALAIFIFGTHHITIFGLQQYVSLYKRYQVLYEVPPVPLAVYNEVFFGLKTET